MLRRMHDAAFCAGCSFFLRPARSWTLNLPENGFRLTEAVLVAFCSVLLARGQGVVGQGIVPSELGAWLNVDCNIRLDRQHCTD